MSFTAKYRTREGCVNCDDDILVGQEIEHTFDGELTHVLCPESLRGGAPKPVCPHCFVELPITGDCECRE